MRCVIDEVCVVWSLPIGVTCRVHNCSFENVLFNSRSPTVTATVTALKPVQLKICMSCLSEPTSISAIKPLHPSLH